MIKIYLTNLGKYNEGELVGEWVELPISEDEFEEVLERIGIDGEEYEEWFIADYESEVEGLEIDEYSSVSVLNELADKLRGLESYEVEILEAMIEENICSNDAQSVMEALNDVCRYQIDKNITTAEELGEYMLFESGLYEVPDFLTSYIDCESFGNDILLDSDMSLTSRGLLARS